MSTALHVAAALSDIDTMYIDAERYNPRHRKPVLETLRVRLMASPLRGDGSRAGQGAMSEIAADVRGLSSLLQRLLADLESGRALPAEVLDEVRSAGEVIAGIVRSLDELRGSRDEGPPL